MERSKYWSMTLTELLQELERRNGGRPVYVTRDGQFMFVELIRFSDNRNVRAVYSGGALTSEAACANLLDYLDELGIE